ncbi:MAG: TrpR YerC/YecD [Lachnospiraceae bacterium]|nr:TrpR YerC/YecD [Lachnospiraceae bacterium]
MARREKRSHTNDLYQAILTLQSEEECIDFFKDVCSNNELLAMEQRYNVAKMLDDGKTYLDIQESTNASTATISRVGRALSEGTGVIGEVLKRQKEA